MIFALTAVIVDEYIAKGITRLSEYLKLSDGIAFIIFKK